jgi:transposase
MVMKHYPPEFKAEAVTLYRSRPHATIAAVAADLGVNSETLRNWIRIDEGRRGGGSSASTPPRPASGSPAEAEVAAARRRIRKVEEEPDIPRKAARYVAGETRW